LQRLFAKEGSRNLGGLGFQLLKRRNLPKQTRGLYKGSEDQKKKKGEDAKKRRKAETPLGKGTQSILKFST